MLKNNLCFGRIANVLAVVLFLAVAVSGCLFQETAPQPTPQTTVTLTPSATASPTENATQTPSPTETSTPTPLPSPTATSTPTATAKPECMITINPNDAPGPFEATAAVRLVNMPEAGNVTVKCTANSAGKIAENTGDVHFAKCEYPYVLSRKTETASAQVGIVSCATTVVIDTNSDYTKSWSFTPGDGSLVMNKSQSNTTVRNYAVSNTGPLELTSISCSSDKTIVTISSCPSSLKAGEIKTFNTTYSISAQNASQQTVIITVKEKDLEKTLSTTLSIIV
ncbi:MAG: hypothetical protein V1717_01220 [Candidatus Micrarchaeota archaeon]